jgi:hypothetical protein
MGRIRRLAARAALIAVAVLAAPGTALADSGAITDVRTIGAGRVTATFTATSDFCGASGYCGFFAYARLVPAAEACTVGRGRPIWVSDDVSAEAGTVRGTEVFTLDGRAPVRLCLFLFQADDREVPIAETVFDPAAGAPAPPSTAPSGGAVRQAPAAGRPSPRRAAALTIRQAEAAAALALRDRYGRAYRRGRDQRRTCRRVSRTQLRCAVSWRFRARRYRGTVTVTSTVTRGRTMRIAVRRSRAR